MHPTDAMSASPIDRASPDEGDQLVVSLRPEEWAELVDVLIALSGAARREGLEPEEAVAIIRCIEFRFSRLLGHVRRRAVQEESDAVCRRLAPRASASAGTLVARLAGILDGEATTAQKARAVRKLARQAVAWMGRYKPVTAAVEALANYSPRSEDEPTANVLKTAARIRAKAAKGI